MTKISGRYLGLHISYWKYKEIHIFLSYVFISYEILNLPLSLSQHSFFSELKDEVVGICNFTWFLNSFD